MLTFHISFIALTSHILQQKCRKRTHPQVQMWFCVKLKIPPNPKSHCILEKSCSQNLGWEWPWPPKVNVRYQRLFFGPHSAALAYDLPVVISSSGSRSGYLCKGWRSEVFLRQISINAALLEGSNSSSVGTFSYLHRFCHHKVQAFHQAQEITMFPISLKYKSFFVFMQSFWHMLELTGPVPCSLVSSLTTEQRK